MPSTWTHPIHARGVRSAWPQVERKEILSDRKIFQYELAGRYGEERQRAAQARLGKPKKQKRLTLAKVLEMLGAK